MSIGCRFGGLVWCWFVVVCCCLLLFVVGLLLVCVVGLCPSSLFVLVCFVESLCCLAFACTV